MKFNFQPPIERNEFVHLPEWEPEDSPREPLSEEPVPTRALLGQTLRAEPEEAMDSRDYLADFLSDGDTDEIESLETDPDASWKHSRWPSVLLLAAIVVLGTVWYLASRSDGGLHLTRVKIEGANLLSNEEVIQLAAIDRSVPFYTINLKAIEHRLLTHSLIRAAHVRREVGPATLVLFIEERQPVALLSSDSTSGTSAGETFIIDRDGLLLRPKLIAGLRDPAKLLQVPLLSGVSAHDTASFQAMAKMVAMIAALDSGALAGAIGEFHRTPTGAYVIYTSETETPIFLGSPFDREFHTALEEQRDSVVPNNQVSLFYRQLQLLARVWKGHLHNELRAGHALYADARFNGQIILKQRFQNGTALPVRSTGTVPQPELNHAQYATNANKRSIQ